MHAIRNTARRIARLILKTVPGAQVGYTDAHGRWRIADVRPAWLVIPFHLARVERSAVSAADALNELLPEVAPPGTRAIRVDDRRAVIVPLPPALRRPVSAERLASRSRCLRAAIGLDPFNRPFVIDFRRYPHLLIHGTTGSGKSTLMLSLAFQLAMNNPANQLRILAVDTKMNGVLSPLAAFPHTLAVETDPAAAEAALRWLTEHMDMRREVFVFVDDTPALLRKRPGCGDLLAILAPDGRASGVHLVIGAQNINQRGLGDTIIRRSIRARLTGMVDDAHTSAQSAGAKRAAHHQLMPGEFVASIGTAWALPIVAARLSGATIRHMTAGIREKRRPWAPLAESLKAAPLAPNPARGGGWNRTDPSEIPDEQIAWWLDPERRDWLMDQGMGGVSAFKRRFGGGNGRAMLAKRLARHAMEVIP